VTDPEVERKPLYGLVTVDGPTEVAAMQLTFDVDLTAGEYELLRQALEPFLRLGVRDMYEFVERNYADINSRNSYYTRLFGFRKEQGRIAPRAAAIGFMGACLNWLNAVRLFLDHEETWLKRRFGEASPQFEDFKRACSEAYDSSVAYRFLYKLRNYVTHCGLPVSKVEIEKPTDAERAAGIHQRIVFRLNRDELLAAFDWGRQVKPDLEAMDVSFEILPLIHDAMPQLWNIMLTVIRTDLKEALSSLDTVLTYIRKMTGSSGQPCLLQMIPNDIGGYAISPIPLPMEVITRLESVDPNGDVLAPFLRMEPSVRPGPPPMSPEGRYRMKRGSLVLSARLHEGGPSQAFVELVNRLIAEDGDIEPVVTGLVTVGITLAYTAAMAMNTTPESILASFAEGNEDTQLDR
jgi:hypothetical protein